MSQVTVDFDPAKSVFVIRCPIWANDLILAMVPNRRWNKGKKAWTTPLLKQNVDHIRELIRQPGVGTLPAADAALRAYDAKTKAKQPGFPAWYKFKTTPLKQQKMALDRLYEHDAVALHMEMQTGKSKAAIDYMAARRMEDRLRGVLILTKLTLRRNWGLQFETHCPLPYSVHYPQTGGPGVKRFERWMSENPDFPIMVVGWESISAGGMIEFCDRFLNTFKCGVVGDETTYITNHKSTRTKNAVSFREKSVARMALAGKPALEGPMNLFSQYEFLDPDIIGIGDFYAYRNRYAVMGGYMKEDARGVKKPMEIVGYQNLDELNKLIAPVTFQYLKKDGYQLPPKMPELRTVEITKVQRDLLNQIAKQQAFSFKGSPDVVMKNVLESALRRHQIAGGYAVKPREVTRTKRDGTQIIKTVYDAVELIKPADNPKMQEVVSVIEEIRGSKQFLLWAVYMPEIEALIGLAERMGLKIGHLHGGVPEEKRQPMVEEFQRGGFDGIIGNASTGGMGYTMHSATVNMFYNNTFRMIDRVQAEDRPWGIGQTQSVAIIDFQAEQTMDGVITEALKQKQNLSDYLQQRLGEITALLDGRIAGQTD